MMCDNVAGVDMGKKLGPILLAVVLCSACTANLNAQWNQYNQKLVGAGAVGYALQGCSVSLSADGNTAIVGGPADSNYVGAAWVWSRGIDGQWSQQGGKLVGTNGVGFPQLQGRAVSLSADGNVAIVGAMFDNSVGSVRVYTRTNGVWSEQQRLIGTSYSGDANQGLSLSLSSDGNTAIVGGPNDNNMVGAVWMWTRDQNGRWNQQGGKLVGAGAIGDARQGFSVAISGDGKTAIVGGDFDDYMSGAAWVWTRDSNNVWTQVAKLVGSGAAGHAQQGCSVSVSADGYTAMVGGYADSNRVGAVWVWKRDYSGVWSQQGAKLVGSGGVGLTDQGGSVCLSGDGNTGIEGGWRDNDSVGAIWLWKRDQNGTWSQDGTKLVGSGAVGRPAEGQSVALSSDGNTALVGGWYDGSNAGATWVFVRIPVGVTERDNVTPSTNALSQNYPNPFNPSTTIKYELPKASHVTLTVFNTLGQQVALLQNGEQEAGYHEVKFDGAGLSSGVYFYRIQAGDFVQTRKLMLIR